MKRDAGAREGERFLCGHKVTGNKAGWVTVPSWSPETLTGIPHGSWNGGLHSVLRDAQQEWEGFGREPRGLGVPLALRPTLLGHDSLLLPLLQIMVPALLVLQQNSRVLQLPGEVVALPLQLVSRLLGLFISSL